MDILMNGTKGIPDMKYLENWDSDEEKCFWRGKKKPIEKIDWVYLVRNGCIVGRVKFIDYRYKKDINNDGKIQEGDAFVLKGHFIKPSGTIKLPKNFFQICGGLWRYIGIRPNDSITVEKQKEEIKNRISEFFKD